AAATSTERWRRRAFRHRGATLRYALERKLYIELANNEALYRLYCASREWRPTGEVRLASRIERNVARRTCGRRAFGRVKRVGPRLAERVVGKFRPRRPPAADDHDREEDARAAAAVSSDGPPSEERPICF